MRGKNLPTRMAWNPAMRVSVEHIVYVKFSSNIHSKTSNHNHHRKYVFTPILKCFVNIEQGEWRDVSEMKCFNNYDQNCSLLDHSFSFIPALMIFFDTGVLHFQNKTFV